MFHDFEFERDIMYASKCEFFLNNADIKTLQKALPVIDGGDNSLLLPQNIKIKRDIPAYPNLPPMYGLANQVQGSQPLIKYCIDTDFGRHSEALFPCTCKFTVLSVVADNIQGPLIQTLRFARQIGPALGISDQWDDRLMKNAGE